MKKILLTLIISISMTMSANAACEHGTLSDDGRFCISNITLNWLSAANWCKANGRHLATIYEVCPNWSGQAMNCGPAIASSISFYAWTSTGLAPGTGWALFLSNGNMGSISANARYHALCL